ncbi:MAG: TatD family hydrolase [Candidatus Staskawiczbacteria bacterium]|jgi:TatD DNase family protein
MLIDSHAHLNFNAYGKDLEDVISRTLKEGVWSLNVGSKYETSQKAIEIAERYEEGVYAVIGLHPIHATPGLMKIKTDVEEGNFKTEGEDFNFDRYEELAKSKKVVAIGEIGLDYYYRPKTKTKVSLFKEKQKEVFIKQLELAKKLDMPVAIHCRMAHGDVIEILGKYAGLKGVIHCFTGSLEEAQKYIAMGFHIGLNGIIFKLNLDEVIRQIPLGRILLETDCPYLTPPQAGAERNEPIFVKFVAQRIAELRGINYEEVAQATAQNTRNLFKI